VKTLLPLYVHPLVDPAAWVALARVGPAAVVVVNIHNGPGNGPDPAYDEATARLAAGGVAMLGYVDLDYGRRDGGQVQRDVDGWRRYPVGGVFYDQAPVDAAGIPGVARAAALVDGTVALNPGTRPDPGYRSLADLVCTFEGPWSNYPADADPDWPEAAHLVYGVPADRLPEAAAAIARRVRYGFATDLDAPLPYLGLPGRAAVSR
jgi:hypothetical protein